jgi:hypothetical protein
VNFLSGSLWSWQLVSRASVPWRDLFASTAKSPRVCSIGEVDRWLWLTRVKPHPPTQFCGEQPKHPKSSCRFLAKEGYKPFVLWQPAQENTVLSPKTGPLWPLSNSKVSSCR